MRAHASYDKKLPTNDDGVAFLTGQLEYVEGKIYAVKYRDIRYPQIVPTSSEAGPWAESITYESIDSRGTAQFLASKGLDIPLVDVSAARSTVGVHHAALGFEYSMQELRVSSQLGRQIDARRGMAVRRGVEELAQSVCFLGDVDHGLPGFLNNAAIPQSSVAGGVWSAKNADAVLLDVNTLIGGIWDTSKTIELVNTLLLPPDQFQDVTTRRLGSVNDTTILDYIRMKNLYTAQTGSALDIQPLSELDGLGAGSTQRMVAYRKDPEVLTFHFPMPLQFLPPQPKGLGFLVPGEFRLSGCEVRYPLACGFSDGI